MVILGDPEYDARFGFERASEHGLGNEYGADDGFMVLSLTDGGLEDVSGIVTYQPEFQVDE